MDDFRQTTLFSGPLVRRRDRQGSREAASSILARLGNIQREVVMAYRDFGTMTSKDCEGLPRFAHYGRSTVQKRISELSLAGILELVPGAETAIYELNEMRLANPIRPEEVPRCPACKKVL